MPLCAPLHLHQELLAIGGPAQHIEHRLPVLLHNAQLLRGDVADVGYPQVWEDHLKELDEDVLVYLGAENSLEAPIYHRVDESSLDVFSHKVKFLIWLNKIIAPAGY